MPKRSWYTEAALEVAVELSALRREAEKAAKDVIPVGQEALEPRELRLRLQTDRAARDKMLREPGGRERMLNLLRGWENA